MPLNWPTSKLRDLADVRVSNVDKKSYAAERPIRLCNYMDVYANDYLTSALIDFMRATASPSEIERFALHAGDVVITKDSETPDDIGVPAVMVEDIDGLVCGYHLALIRPKASVHPTFLAKQLASAQTIRYFAAHATGSTRFGLTIGTIEKLDVPNPPIAEQSKIAEVHSTVDRAIEQTEALIAKQQRIKIGLMQDLLTRGIDEHGDLRSEQTHKFKDSPLGRIPVEWEVRDLQSLLANVSSPMRSGPFGSALLKEELVDSGVPLLGIDNVLPERFVPDFKRFVSPKKAVQLHRFRVRPRDLMITIMGTVGRCCVVPENIGEALSSKHVWTLSLNQDLYSPFLACLQINHSPWVHEHFARDQQGGIMASIRSETLRTTRLPTPPPPEMLRIKQILRAAADDLRKIENTMGKMALLKSGLMQDLLTGNRRVTALLERREGVMT